MPLKPDDDDDILFDADPTRVAFGNSPVRSPASAAALSPAAVAVVDADVSKPVKGLLPVEGQQRVGRYHLRGLIGKGGMAEVFLAKQDGPAGFAKTCVVKRIRRSLAEEKRFVEMFLREARVAARLNHPNCVQIFELGEDNGEYFLAMEFLDGVSLHRAARRTWHHNESVPMEVALRAIADSALGLHHAHTLIAPDGRPSSLVHRDVSPDNIMLTRDGVSKLLDFGIAKSTELDEQTSTGEVKGKIPFMSPEQLQGFPLDGRSDLWSLGITMYWLLTGKRPFDGSSEPMTIDGIMRRDPLPPRELNPLIPHSVEAVIMKLLAKDPLERVSSGAELADTLLNILGPSAGYAAAATFAAKAMAWEDADPRQPLSALTIVAARPETNWLKRLDDESGQLERLFPPSTPTGQRRAVFTGEGIEPDGPPSTGKTVTGLQARQMPRRSPALPIAAGVAAAAIVAVAMFAFLRSEESDRSNIVAVVDAVKPVVTPGDVVKPNDDVKPNDVEPNDDVKPNDVKPNDAKPNDVKPNDVKGIDDVKPDDAKSDVKSDAKSADVRSNKRDERPSIRTIGPGRVSWRAGKSSLGKGSGSFKVPKGTTRVTAVDAETGGVSEVNVVDGVADYKSLGTGTVVVRVKPWANVTLGGKKLGETPIDPLSLPVGRYVLKFEREGLSKTATVDVKEGATSTVNIDLRD